MKRWNYFALVILLFASCEKEANWINPNIPPNVIVVDGIITTEIKQHQLFLSRPVAELNGLPQPVSGASISIASGDSVYLLHEDVLRPGYYLTHTNASVFAGLPCSIVITYGDTILTASTMVLAGESYERLRYSKNSSDSLYHIDWVADQYNPDDYAIYEIIMDWSMVPGYENYSPENNTAKLYYYTLYTLDVGEILQTDLAKLSFPLGTQIIERRYSITKEHASFIRSLMLETSWHGSLFDVAHGNVPSNFVGPGLGFFAACGVVETSFTVNE